MKVGDKVWYRGQFVPGFDEKPGEGIRGTIELDELPKDERIPEGAVYGVRLENGNVGFADENHVATRKERYEREPEEVETA